MASTVAGDGEATPAARSDELGGVAWNLSRIIGPLLGGAIISIAAGLLPNRATAPGVVFAVNAVSFLGVVAVFARWKRVPHESNLPSEHILSAVRAGWRYTRHSPELRAILVRNGAFMLCISAQFSLLPLYARTLLHLNASGYASLLAFFGAAAVLSNILFPRLRERFTPSQLLFYSTLANSFNLLVLALVPGRVPEGTDLWLVRASLLFGGTAWPIVMQTCQVTLVRSVPNWVRSRAAGMLPWSLWEVPRWAALCGGRRAAAGHPHGFCRCRRCPVAGIDRATWLRHCRSGPGQSVAVASLARSRHGRGTLAGRRPCAHHGRI
jgi:MFS-type transporter involved in bile tolerance (Atg22 family)